MRLVSLTVCLILALGLCTKDGRAEESKKAQKHGRDGYYTLFNGKDLNDWKISDAPGTFRVEDGLLIVNGPRSHLFYMGPVHNHDFKNFELKVECMTFPHANSGIYFHTEYQPTDWPSKGFEVQVNQTHSDVKKSGGLYDIKDVMNQSSVKDNEWYWYDIVVKDKHVVVKMNGKVTCDWTQPEGFIPPKGHEGRIISSGTIAIQGHDPGSKILYRTIKIKPLD